MENPVDPVKSQTGKIWLGVFISLGAWIVDAILATLLLGWALYDRNSTGTFVHIFQNMFFYLVVILAVIWLPVAIIAGFMTRKRKIKGLRRLMLITAILAPILVGCGSSILFGMSG